MTGQTVCGYRLVRELGSRALPSYLALDPRAEPTRALCVVDRLTRDPSVSAEASADFLRDAKRLAKMRHANVALVRDVAVGTNTVLLVTEWIEGETFAGLEVAAMNARGASSGRAALSLEVRLRVLLDLLEGISALHQMRDDSREPAPLVHAEVGPGNLVVTTDGRALLTHPLRAPARANRPPSPDALGYLAPEVLLADQTADSRADVYGAGVLLWEALSGRRMHREGEPVSEIVMRLLGGKVEPLSVPPQAPWTAPLVAIAKRATSADPSIRYPDATAMLAEVRRAVGTHLAPKTAVAAVVEELAGVRIRARRARPSQAEALRAVRSSAPVVVSMRMAPEEPQAAISTVPPPDMGADGIDPIDVIVDVEVPGAPSIPDVPPPSAIAPPPPSGASAGPPLRAVPARDVPVPARERDASKTDLGALELASTPPPASPARTKWIVGGAAAVAAAVVVWLAGRGSEPTAAGAHPEAASPPTTATAAEPSPAAAPLPEPEAAKTPASASVEVPPRPAIPAVTASPAAAPPPPAAPPAAAPSPPPSSPHPKKRVYDPQGI